LRKPAVSPIKHSPQQLELPEERVRVGRRISIVEAGHQANVDHVVIHRVNPAAPERIGRQRRPQRVNDRAGRESSRRDPPEFLDADGIGLRVTIAVEAESRDRRLGQGPARALAQHDDFREQIGAGLEVRFGSSAQSSS
jgi:hypothetical protein